MRDWIICEITHAKGKITFRNDFVHKNAGEICVQINAPSCTYFSNVATKIPEIGMSVFLATFISSSAKTQDSGATALEHFGTFVHHFVFSRSAQIKYLT